MIKPTNKSKTYHVIRNKATGKYFSHGGGFAKLDPWTVWLMTKRECERSIAFAQFDRVRAKLEVVPVQLVRL